MKNLIKFVMLLAWAGVSIPAIKLWRGFNWLAPSTKDKCQLILYVSGTVVGILAICLLTALFKAVLL